VYPVLEGRGGEADVDLGAALLLVKVGGGTLLELEEAPGEDVGLAVELPGLSGPPPAIGTIPMPPRAGGTNVANADCSDDFVEQKSATEISGPSS